MAAGHRRVVMAVMSAGDAVDRDIRDGPRFFRALPGCRGRLGCCCARKCAGEQFGVVGLAFRV
jgi:hypothetical protein